MAAKIKWQIKYYPTSSNKSPIKEFIDRQDEITKSKIYSTFELLREFGTNFRMPHAKKIIRTPLWELRVLGVKSTRFFYIAQTGRVFVILHAFIKKSQKTPQKELKTAFSRYKELI